VITELLLAIVSQIKVLANVEKLKMETYSTITKIRSDADKMENERRIVEETS
jgi:hypothetical protein